MAAEVSYARRISRFKRNDLLNLWASIEVGNTPGWEAGKAFEYLVLRAFELEGAEIRWPYRVDIGDEEVEQIDGVVYSNALACLIECKDTVKGVNVEPIAKLRNQLLRRPASTLGVIFSRSGFTEPAMTLASFVAPQTIILWNGDELAYALRKKIMRKALAAKYRFGVEHGLAFYDMTSEKLL